MGKRIDFTGQRFGKLVVESFSHTDKNHRAHWKCLCDCGNYSIVLSGNLGKNRTKTCGKCPKSPSHSYVLSEDKAYYMAYKMIETKGNDDLSIFEVDGIEIEAIIDKSIGNLITKPDFIFDAQFFEKVSNHNWGFHISNGFSSEIKCKTFTLQSFIILLVNKDIRDNNYCTFKNDKYYDYRLENLMFQKDKKLIVQKSYRKNKTGYKGVNINGKKYSSKIRYKGTDLYIGLYDTPEQAAETYNEKAKELFGKFAYQNVIKKPRKSQK